MDAVRRLADAVLYEGYILWPYRRSALKNQKRWTFGGVYPPAHSEQHPDDRAALQAQCLVEAGATGVVEVTVRFLQVVERRVAKVTGRGLEFVEELDADGVRHLPWDEAVEREISLRLPLAERRVDASIAILAGAEEEHVGDAGVIVRRWEELGGTVGVESEQLGDSLHRLTARVVNETHWRGAEREDALRRTFCSTHLAFHAEHGAFVSQTDPPDELAETAGACVNVGVWPVLVGEAGARDTMLAAPIILEDYAQIAPESPGDLFDAGEIDRLLILNVLSLTDEEKEEMRATDPRAREILERCAALRPEELLPLHGAIRDFRPAAAE
jgi:hypothetical protein